MPKYKSITVIGSYAFDPLTNALGDAQGIRIPLRPETAAVLGVLADHRGKTVSRSDLIKEVSANIYISSDGLERSISEIREVLGEKYGYLMKTIPGEGYRLEANWTKFGRPFGERFKRQAVLILLIIVVIVVAGRIGGG